MYKQVTDQIREFIATGSLAEETKLPSIREMAASLGTSPITIKRAYADLQSEGFIVTRPGLGSYVSGLDRDKIRAEKEREIQGELIRIVKTAGVFGIPRDEIQRMVDEAKEEIDDSV